MYYLKLHPSGNIVFWPSKQEKDDIKKQNSRRHGIKRQTQNGLWTTPGRLLHPRPAVPTAFSDIKAKEISNNSNKTKSEVGVYKGADV